MKYDKLVRDKIPEIIRSKGETPVVHIADTKEYLAKLKIKLTEEVTEFLRDENVEELADILEVVYALGGRLGTSATRLEALRKKKADERGGFEQGIVLEETQP